FDEILKSQLNVHAAWLPITNTFKVGDYGAVSDGVFVKAGNIKSDFGVAFEHALGPNSTLNFTSKGTNVLRAVGEAQVDAFPESDVDAKFSVEFSQEKSFLLKAILGLLEMQNINSVAQALYNKPEWHHRFRVVSAVYTARDCALISSAAKNSKIELS